MKPKKLPLIIRADANTRMGTGHLMRCLALAQAWKDRGGDVVFLTACDSDGLLQRLRDEGFWVVELEESYPDPREWEVFSQILGGYPDAWVVLDGYHFDSAYQKQIKATSHPLLVIDDMAHLNHYYADVILNQNIHAPQLDYSCEPDTRLLLGTDYVLLRREFWTWRDWEREIPDVARKVLVTLGGADPENQTLKVIYALQDVGVDGLEVKVVGGANNLHLEKLKSESQNSNLNIDLVYNVANMPELMAWADMAVTAGGITSWEIAFLGLPNLTLVLANNQGLVAEGLDQSGAAIKLGWYLKIGKEWIAGALKDLAFDSARRRKMAQTGQELVDGQGVQRVIDILAESEIVRGLQIRSASWEDVNLLWKWANDPSVRENSFHPEPIGRDEHVEWFKKKLADSGTRIWIIEMDGEPVAQIRYDRVNSGIAEIGFSVSLGYRGQEIGTKTLRMTSTRACEELNVQCLRGIVLRHNEASGRVFQKAGFRKEQKNKIIKGRECDVYLLKCESRGKSL